jgi:hypothetical protein
VTQTPRDEPVLAQARSTAPLAVALDEVDLADCVLNLTDAEYRDCAPGEHKAYGRSQSADGSPLAICVEAVGGQLTVQHYHGVSLSPVHCRWESVSDALAGQEWTTVHVIWEITAAVGPDGTPVFTNSIESRATADFQDWMRRTGATLDALVAARTEAIHQHNERETPAFAESIARRSRQRASSTHRGDT